MQPPTSTAESTLAARTERLQAALERARERSVRLRVSARGDWDLLTDVVGCFESAGPLA